MKFLAENRQGDGIYAVEIEAGNQAEAICICERFGYVFRGEIGAKISFDDLKDPYAEARRLCDALNEAQTNTRH